MHEALLALRSSSAARAISASGTWIAVEDPGCSPRCRRRHARIDEAGEKGYAIVMNQTVVGDISVAAAITDHHGRPIAAINISVPATRWSVEAAEEQLVAHVQLAAASISQAKGAVR